MRARGLPPDAPARRHVRAVVLAIACTCFALPSGRVQYVYEYVCVWVHGCVYASVCVRAYVLLRLPSSPRLASARPFSPPLLSSLLLSPRLGFFSLGLLPLSSQGFACPLLSPPHPFPSFFFPSVLAPPLPSLRSSSPLPPLSSSLPPLLRG